MDYSRRETLALGGGVAAGLLTGGLVGVRPAAPRVRPGGSRPDGRRAAAATYRRHAGRGDRRRSLRRRRRRGTAVGLDERRTLVVGPLDAEDVRDLAADHRIDYLEPDPP